MPNLEHSLPPNIVPIKKPRILAIVRIRL